MPEYRQCELKRTETPGGDLMTTVTHIPSDFAKIGKFVDLKENGSWLTWQVVKVSPALLSEQQAKNLAKKWHDKSTFGSLQHK